MKAALLFVIALVILHNVTAGCEDQTPPCTCKTGVGMWKTEANKCKYVCKKDDKELSCEEAEKAQQQAQPK